MGLMKSVFGLFFLPVCLAGQAPNIVTSVGYSNPTTVAVAPGQVITLFAHTQTKVAHPVVADGPQFPTTLGGFAVSLSQTFSTVPIPVPILSISPVETCSAVVPEVCNSSTAITVQIPFELVPNVPSSRLPENFAVLRVTENGNDGEPLPLDPVSDRIHIVNSCDAALNPQSGPCRPLFLHSDGSLVSSKNPAAVGESIALRAYGLGYPDTRVATGAAAPSQVSVSGVLIDFRFSTGAEAGISKPGLKAVPVATQLVAGVAGVYEMVFPIPALPAGTADCTAVTNNLTVVVGRGVSYDGAGLCVSTDQ
jgi:uncharacterized protein (TIGR03437 family)